MPENVSRTFATTRAFWAAVQEQVLQEWESDPSRAKWDSIKHVLVGVNKCLLATIGPRENTAATELKRIRRQIYPELRRLERQVASRMKKLQRQVRATVKRIGHPPQESPNPSRRKGSSSHYSNHPLGVSTHQGCCRSSDRAGSWRRGARRRRGAPYVVVGDSVWDGFDYRRGHASD